MQDTLCAKCLTSYKPAKNGMAVVFYRKGYAEQLWFADLKKCACGRGVIQGFSNTCIYPSDEQFQTLIQNAKKNKTLIKVSLP